MYRRILYTAVALMLALSLFSAPAMAATSNTNSTQYGLNLNNILVGVLYTMVENANNQIEAAVRQAQMTPYDDVNLLLIKVACITAPVFIYARIIDATVICEYVTYFIDGRFVEIDPLRVVNV